MAAATPSVAAARARLACEPLALEYATSMRRNPVLRREHVPNLSRNISLSNFRILLRDLVLLFSPCVYCGYGVKGRARGLAYPVPAKSFRRGRRPPAPQARGGR